MNWLKCVSHGECVRLESAVNVCQKVAQCVFQSIFNSDTLTLFLFSFYTVLNCISVYITSSLIQTETGIATFLIHCVGCRKLPLAVVNINQDGRVYTHK